MKPYYSDKCGDIYHGNALEVLRVLPDESMHCCVTDPPYELGFMGKKWDSSGIAFNVDVWREILRVLKPGAHLLAFGGTRTHHRLICAIEDAGFEVRDCIAWAYSTGFPKSLDISKTLDRMAGVEREVTGISYARNGVNGQDKGLYAQAPRGNTFTTAPTTESAKQWEGYGTALKPAVEIICLARKPIESTVAENVLKHGCGGLNIGKSRIGTGEDKIEGRTHGKIWGNGRKAPVDKTQGRFPANLIHDGSPEVVGLFPETHGHGSQHHSGSDKGIFNWGTNNRPQSGGESGTAARFFKSCPFDEHDLETARLIYQAKASPAERGAANNHPTVKPLSLMQYLIELACPPDGTILDPFFGSGTTGIAAYEHGRRFIGIELSLNYITEIAIPRIKKATEQLRLFA